MRVSRALPASLAGNLVRTALMTAAFQVIALGAGPWAVMKLHYAIGDTRLAFPPLRTAAVVLFVCFGGAYIIAAMTLAIAGRGTPSRFAGPRHLVTIGPYAFVRNPMVLAAAAQGMAVSLYGGSLLLVAYTLIGVAFWALFLRRAEERELVRCFGRAYEVYRRGVPSLFPRTAPWRPVDDAPTRTLVISDEVGAPRGRRRRA
jgi:protein-S-isoprenylcysteine O-methyltransferase Ste14